MLRSQESTRMLRRWQSYGACASLAELDQSQVFKFVFKVCKRKIDHAANS